MTQVPALDSDDITKNKKSFLKHYLQNLLDKYMKESEKKFMCGDINSKDIGKKMWKIFVAILNKHFDRRVVKNDFIEQRSNLTHEASFMKVPYLLHNVCFNCRISLHNL